MELFWKTAGGVLVAVVLGLSVQKDMSMLLSMVVCAMATVAALEYAKPVLELLRQLETAASLQGDTLKILFKILGVGIVAEIGGMVCMDAGNGSMAKVLKLLAYMGILWLSIPIFQSVLSVLQQILGEV